MDPTRIPVFILLLIQTLVLINCEETTTQVNNETTTVLINNENASHPVLPQVYIPERIVPDYVDGIANIKFVCGLTIELYNETGDGILKAGPKSRLAPVCCPGYKRNFRGICAPFCKGGCGDGICEFPEMCTCPRRNCAFNTVERNCVCFEGVCPTGCPNATCVADNVCECNEGFLKSSNWTAQYTNSTADCLPYCFPFCSNQLFTTPELCRCDYAPGGDNETFKNGSLEDFGNQRKTQAYLGSLFQSHGHPSFTSGLVGFGLGAMVGHLLTRNRNNKNNNYGGGYGGGYGGYGNPGHGYGAPGGFGSPGYGSPGGHYGNNGQYPHNNYGGYPNSGHTQYGAGYPHTGQTPYGQTPHGSGYPQTGQAPYGSGYPQTGQTPHGSGYPQSGQAPYGSGYPQTGQTPHGSVYPQSGQAPHGSVYPQTGQTPHGSVYPQTGQAPPGSVYPQTGQAPYGSGTNPASGVPGQANTGQSKPAWSNPYYNQGTSGNPGQNPGTSGNPGQNPNYGWAGGQAATGDAAKKQEIGKSTSTNLGSSSSGTGQRTNIGWNIPSGTTNTGTSSVPKGTGSSGSTSLWPWSTSSGKSNSGGGSGSGSSGRGSSGRKRGRKH